MRAFEAQVRVIGGEGDESWDDWVPKLGDADSERFKWGWNAIDGDVVWRVSGPGDGLPAHAEQLGAAWGREPSPTSGDVLGTADYLPARGSRPALVVVDAFYGERVPASVVDWFHDTFPHAQLRVLGISNGPQAGHEVG